jgi:septum formation protein
VTDASLFLTTEKAIRHEDPIEMPVLIAKAKADELIKRHNLYNLEKPALLITSDQIVLHKTTVREKPENRAEAVEFLASYSSDAVSTVSAVVVTHLPSGIQESGVDIATVYWKEIPDDVVMRVVDKGETMYCAGGFMIEDPDLNPLVKGVDRPVDSVMGLPVDLTKRLMVQVAHLAEQGGEAHAEHKYAHK